MFVSYGSLRSQFPLSAFTATTQAGGSLPSPGTINIRIAGKNRAGYNLPSDAILLSYTAGQKIVVALTPDARKSGEDLFEIAILGETTGNPANSQILATWQAKELNQVSPRQLPAIVEINSLAGKPFPYSPDLTASGGCDSSSCLIPPPPYKGDGSESTPIVYWCNNGLTESGAAIRATTGINLQVLVGGSASTAFLGKIIISLLGYVRRSTGELLPVDNTSKFAWQGEAIALPQDLEPGYAVAFAVSLQFRASEVNVPLGSSLSIDFTDEAPQGVQVPSGTYPSNAVFPEGQRLLIVPERSGSFRRFGGLAVIKGWRTPTLGEAVFFGLVPDTPNQRLAISGALGGDVRVLLTGEEPRTTEAIRAIVSTASGEAAPSNWSNEITLSAPGGIQVSVGYPCNAEGRGTIRADYPDGGSRALEGAFNPPYLRVYVSVGGSVYRLNEAIAITPGVGQVFSIASLDSATQIAGLPAGAADFCLFGYNSVEVRTASGSIPAGKVKVAVSYFYPPSNTEITSITHDPAKGCIPSFTALTDAETLNNQVPAYYLSRANHTGQQAIATIIALQETLNTVQSQIERLTQLKQDASELLTALAGLTTDGLVRKTASAFSTATVTTAGINLIRATLAEQRQILGVTANSTDASTLSGQSAAHYLSRANHTGTQPISSVGELQTALDSKQPAASILTAVVNAGTGLLNKNGNNLTALSFSSLGQSLLQSATTAAARQALQLGSAAQQNATAFEASGEATRAVAQHESTHTHATSADQIGGLLAANNLAGLPDTTQARTNLGLGTAAVENASAFDPVGAAVAVIYQHLQAYSHPTSADQIGGLLAAGNLAGLPDTAEARANLGLGTAATQNAGVFEVAGAATSAVSQHLSEYSHPTSAGQIGGLLAASNLADIADPVTARTNLGVDTSQFAPISHTTTYGNGAHIPTAGITNGHVAPGAAIAFAKLSGVAPLPSSGTLAARPAASAANNGRFYLATDQFGGTLYLCVAAAWVQAGRGVTQ